jgi:cyclase
MLTPAAFTIALTLSAALAGGAAAQPAPAAPAAPLPTLVKVRPDVYVVQNVNHIVAEIGQNGGNLTVLVTPDGVVLVDTKNERMYDDVVATVKSITDRPIRYAILTHNHGDHAGGAARFQQAGVTIVSSLGTIENMTRAGARGVPHVGYSGQAELLLGGRTIALREFRGHTRGDTVVLVPDARLVVAGDLVTTPDTIPAIVNYADGGSWTDLTRTLDAIATLDFDTLIGGHGPPLTRQEFLTFRDRARAIRDRFRALNRERKTQDEIGQTLLKEFNWGSGPAAGNLAGMMQELR